MLALVAGAGLAVGGLALVFTGSGQPAVASDGPAVREEQTHLLVLSEGEWWNVEIHSLVYDDGSGRYAEAAAEARAGVLARFPGAIEVTPSEVSAQYLINPYWWPSHVAEWSYNPAGKPTGLANDAAAVQASAAAWSGAGAMWAFTGGGATTAGTGACLISGRDHKNTVGWAPKPGQTLAETCTWYPYGGLRPIAADEFDMEIDPDWSWSTGSPVKSDLQSVVTHEFGHALGLGHPPESTCPGPIMCASYRAGTLARTPQADDVAGLVAIYGAAPVPTPTPSPTPTIGPHRNIAPALAKDR